MKSPITHKEMKLAKERRSIVFRKDTFSIIFHYYKCEDSGEQFTTTELDELNMNQVYNLYRDKFNIPFTEEINRIRQKYGLSATKMSQVLGFGINSYRLYEAGEIPSEANAKLIQLADNPTNFHNMVGLCGDLDEKTKAKYLHKANLLAEEKKRNNFETPFREYLLGSHQADVYSGYRNPNLEKFTEMVVYFSKALSPYKTKMNKLLFYADFLEFKKSCFSISGMRYHAINLGPVPNNFQSIFEYLANKSEIEIAYTELSNGYPGEQFICNNNRKFNEQLFSEGELQTLKEVATAFKTTSTNDIINLSHLEEAWIKNEKKKAAISYEYAFELSQI